MWRLGANYALFLGIAIVIRVEEIQWYLQGEKSGMVGENGSPYRHHGALYDDVISTHPFKFLLANQKARFTNLTIQSTPSI